MNRNINPSDLDDVFGEYPPADAEQTRQAIAAAAFPAWARGNIPERGDLLDRVGDAILRRKTELGTLLSGEEDIADATRQDSIRKAAESGSHSLGCPSAAGGGGDALAAWEERCPWTRRPRIRRQGASGLIRA